MGQRARVQQVIDPERPLTLRNQSEAEIVDWVSTFWCAEAVVNLCSTVGIDSAGFDTPVVNLDHGPERGQPNQEFAHEINRVWTHFAPVVRSGGLAMATDDGEVIDAVRAYLADPSLDREGRERMVALVCGPDVGRAGKRFADHLRDAVEHLACDNRLQDEEIAS